MRIYSSDDYYCSGKTLCYFIVHKLYSKNKDYHSHNTRNKNHLKIPAGTKNFTSNSARIWNTISTKMNVNVTLVQFKANLKLYLLNDVLEFIYSK